MNTELVIAYYTIFQKVSYSLLHHFPKKKRQLVIFLIISVFCEHANKKEKNITARIVKVIAQTDLISFSSYCYLHFNTVE